MTQNQSHHRNVMQFGLMGASLDTGNMGVSALAASVVGLILRNRPGTVVKFFIGNRSSEPQTLAIEGQTVSLPVINYRWSPHAKPHEHMGLIFLLALLWRLIPIDAFRNWIKKSNRRLNELSQVDLVGEIRGGDSFSDIYGVHRFLIGSLPVLIAVFLGKRLFLLPQTYGPFKHKLSQFFARYIFNHAERIFSRDRESLSLVKSLLKGQSICPPMRFCPDVAFTLATKEIEAPHIVPPLPTTKGTDLVGFNINGLMYNGGYSQANMFQLKLDYRHFALQLIIALLRTHPCHILLVPHTFGHPGSINSDPDACLAASKQVPAELQDRVHLVMHSYDQYAMKSIIGRCDFFIGSRMHSCIAALSHSIPTIGVAYSKKFNGVFKSVGVGEWVVDARKIDSEQAIAMIVKAIGELPHMRSRLQIDFPKFQQHINDCFMEILHQADS